MLAQLITEESFGYLLVSTRMAAMVMLFPALGDKTVPIKIRVSFAMVVSVIVYMSVKSILPTIPDNTWSLMLLLLRELLVGVMIGTVTRFIMSAAHVAGTIISMNTGLAAAQSFDPSQGGQSAIVSSMFNMFAVIMIFVTNTHHLLILALAQSYTNFPIGESIPFSDFAGIALHYVATSFELGVQLASPFILYSLIFNVSLGLIAKLNPQFQVFFISMPLNIYMGLTLVMLLMPTILTILLDHMRKFLLQLLG